jgi:hypothetical protein
MKASAVFFLLLAPLAPVPSPNSSLPSRCDRTKNKSIYHFYTIGYVAQELKKCDYTAGMSFLTATMVNYRYETLFGLDPEQEQSVDDREDIYLDYAGALYALGEKTKIITPADFTTSNPNLRTPAFVRMASQMDNTTY